MNVSRYGPGLGVALAKSRSVRAAKDVHLHPTPENMQEEMKQ